MLLNWLGDMYNGCLSSSVAFSANGSVPIRFSDSFCCFDLGLQSCRLLSNYSVSCCCCFCTLCVHRVNLNSSLVYGLKQSSLLHLSGGRRLRLSGAGPLFYSRLNSSVDYGLECCDDRSEVWRGRSEKWLGRGKGRIGGLRLMERREWRMYAGELRESEDLIDLLADSMGDNTVVKIETEIIRPRRKKEVKKKKKENVCDECSRKKIRNVASGSSRAKLRHDELKEIDITGANHERKRKEDLRSEKKEKLRKSGDSESLGRKSRHEELTRADLVNVAHRRRRSKDVNVQSEKNERLRKDGSGCTSYYSLSSSGEIESDEEIVSVEEFENSEYAEEQSGKYDMEIRNRIDKERYGLVKQTERHGKKQQGIRIEEITAGGSNEGNGVVRDRKKSEKQLIETAVDQSKSAADNTKKHFTASEVYNSTYSKSDMSGKQFQSSGESSTLVSNRREGRIHSDETDFTEISRSRRRYRGESQLEEIHESDTVTNSNQLVQLKVQQDDASTSTKLSHDIKEQREQDVIRISSQQHTGSVKIQKDADIDKVSNLRHGKQSTSVQTSGQELKEDHRQNISTVTEAELRRTSQHITNIAEVNRTEIQNTSTSNQQSAYRIKIGEDSSLLVKGLSKEEAGTIRQAVREDRQRIESRKGSKASLESFVQSSGQSTTIDSQTTSHQVMQKSEEKRQMHSQRNESYKQIEMRSERERLAQESSYHEASEYAFNSSLETGEQVDIKARDKRTTQSVEMLAAHQPETGGSLSKLPTTSHIYEKASQHDIEDRYGSQHLRQQGQYLSSPFESYGGDETYAQPLTVISSGDALGSAERMANSSNILIQEFVEQAESELLASEVKEETVKKTNSENEDSKKQTLLKYGFAGAELNISPHSSEGSQAKGLSDEKWDVAQSSVEPPHKTKSPEVSPKAGNTPVKRTGRSLWNVIGDAVRARWNFHGESHKPPSKSRKRSSSSNESVSSDTWFSGHEHDENVTKAAENRSPFHESVSPSNLVKPEKEHSGSQLVESDAVAVLHEHGMSGSSLTTGFSGSSPAVQGVSLTREEVQPSSSGSEMSILSTFSTPGMLGTSISLPSRRLSRSPAIGGTSLNARNDSITSGSGEQIDQQPSPLRLTEASGPEDKEGQLTRRKFQRIAQVPRDKFEEWEEAFKRETEQHKIDDIFMLEALVEAQKAADNWEVPVGAVLVHDGKIIARGCNLVEELRDSTAHAEMICIRDASNALRTWRLSETTLYVTLEPCAMCAGAILQARITTLVWGAPNKLLGADGSWIRLFPDDGVRDNNQELADKPSAPVHPFHPKMNIRRGVLAAECGQVMQQFFHLRRQKKNKSEPSSPQPSCLPASTNPVKLITKVHGLFGSSFCL